MQAVKKFKNLEEKLKTKLKNKMKINATIKQVLPAVSGTSEKGEYKFVPIVIAWEEQFVRRDSTIYNLEHSLVVNIMGQYANNFSLPVGARVNIDIRFNTREIGSKVFNSVTSNFIVLS